MKITAEQLRKVYEGARISASFGVADAPHAAALLAVAHFVAQRQRDQELTASMLLHGCIAVSDIYAKDGGWCGLKAAEDQVVATYRAMQSVAPLVVEG